MTGYDRARRRRQRIAEVVKSIVHDAVAEVGLQDADARETLLMVRYQIERNAQDTSQRGMYMREFRRLLK